MRANQIVNFATFLLRIFSNKIKKITLLTHNGNFIDDYPETHWYLVPFPKQKGIPYNSDNLATVNRHKFLEDDKFLETLHISEKRWGTNGIQAVRDISWRLHTTLWAVSLSLKDIDIENEIFIECGTGKGYMAAGICHYFNWDKLKPVFFLIDSFKSTMPEVDGSQVDTGKKLFVYADGDEEVRKYFSKYSRVEVIKGMIPSILNALPDDKTIKFLHLDLNSHIAEKHALDNLVGKLKTGSVILFDDYGGMGGALQAEIHELFAVKYNKSLLCIPTGQAIIIW